MQNFQSQLSIGDAVQYRVYNSIVGVLEKPFDMYGTIVSVRFTKGKVMYDILDDITTQIHRDIYSENVSGVDSEHNQPNNEFRDVIHYVLKSILNDSIINESDTPNTISERIREKVREYTKEYDRLNKLKDSNNPNQYNVNEVVALGKVIDDVPVKEGDSIDTIDRRIGMYIRRLIERYRRCNLVTPEHTIKLTREYEALLNEKK